MASPAIAVALADSNTVTMAVAMTAAITNTVTTSITITVAATGSSTATSSSTTASAAFGQRRACRQSSDCESEHEHSESCHVAPPP